MTTGYRQLLMVGMLTISMALVLAACVQIEVESEFESDGSATHSLSSSVDRSFMDDEMMGGELDGELDFEEIEREGEAAGFTVEQIDTADRLGVRLSTQVEDNDDLGEVLNELFSAQGGEAPPVDGFEGGFSDDGGFGGNSYRFELTVDGDALFEGEFGDDLDDEVDDEMDMDFGPDMIQQFLNMTYTVALPGEITDHNGTDLGGGRVQWNIPFEGTETFFAESEDGSSLSLALIIGIGIGVIALALIVVGGIILMRPKTAPSSAASTGAPEDTTRQMDPPSGQP